MNTDAWINRTLVIAGSTDYERICLQLGQAVERLQARQAAAPAPLPIVEVAEPMIDLHRSGRRGPYERRKVVIT